MNIFPLFLFLVKTFQRSERASERLQGEVPSPQDAACVPETIISYIQLKKYFVPVCMFRVW